jgi:hypothetical protein
MSSEVLLIKEHVDKRGRLLVPVRGRLTAAPARPGWVPVWVNANCDRIPEQLITYMPAALPLAHQVT